MRPCVSMFACEHSTCLRRRIGCTCLATFSSSCLALVASDRFSTVIFWTWYGSNCAMLGISCRAVEGQQRQTRYQYVSFGDLESAEVAQTRL